MPNLFSYVVRFDVGFAPNPFHGFCSLACCKPNIRKKAEVGDFIIGITSKAGGAKSKILYIMEVTEVVEDFNEYWNNPRFAKKRPNLSGSVKQCVGDNIYHQENGVWIQEDSRHSNLDRTTNEDNLKTDTKANRILLSTNFVYWGSKAIDIPSHLRRNSDDDIVVNRGHKQIAFSQDFVDDFKKWFESLDERNIRGEPTDWVNNSEFIKTVRKR